MKYTPGPWKVVPSGFTDTLHGEYNIQSINEDIYIGRCWYLPHAKLVAAAPDLLEACKDALSRLEEFIGSDCECDNTHEQNGTVCCLCMLRQTINKAIEE